jgi:hypothetical protein
MAFSCYLQDIVGEIKMYFEVIRTREQRLLWVESHRYGPAEALATLLKLNELRRTKEQLEHFLNDVSTAWAPREQEHIFSQKIAP